MTKIRSTKNALISAILVLTLSVSALLGTTFAWFTDSVTSSGNKIAAGNLKVDLELLDKESNTWKSLKRDKDPIFSNEKWEPGYTEVKMLKVENEGSLTLTWKATMVSYGEISELAEVIDVYVRDFGVLEDASSVTYPTGRNLDGYTRVGTAAEFLSTMEETTKGVLNAGQSAYLGLALKMREDAGNEYQGMSLGGTFDIVILATQGASEEDSFDSSYDTNATFPEAKINFTASKPVTDKIENGAIKEDLQVCEENSKYNANVPAGVAVADGADALELSITTITEDESNANITLDDDEEVLTLDVHMDGVAENNTVPMQITLKGLVKKGLNPNNIGLYHVEDGATVQMTAVSTLAELDAHNEFYYNAATGDVVLSLASFSEVAVVADVEADWKGESADAFNGGTGTEKDPYIIANAAQLAYFRDLVDGGKDFDDEYVKLANDIILNHHDEMSNLFDPIGWGYAHRDYNRGDAEGKVFMGTFDGGGHAIHGLWQNGWALEEKTGTVYTYTNCGFGLFASVKDATIKNLTMKHANVVVECVEAGVVVGLAQGSCTFENIYVYHAKIANYQRPAGGVVGEVSAKYENGTPVESTCKFINVHVGSSTTVGSLWGDFDAPCGGVIGAYWDDSNLTKIEMDSVDVSCVMDVYSDVTSAYQWYAYRRAGMLIGNTDRAETVDGRTVATAPFLTVKDLDGDGKSECVVIYDESWVNYSYCEFTNAENPGKNYPWVRVEPGLNCSAYSNPRYGHPIDAAGNTVVDDLHIHDADDECTVVIPFNQLYGGGQGVYGQPKHDGVAEGKYTITFIGADGDIADVKYITDSNKITALNDSMIPVVCDSNGQPPLRWEDANGKVYATYDSESKTWTYAENAINENNLVDIVLYPEWPNEFNIYFVDHNGKTLYYEKFTEGTEHSLNESEVAAALASVQNQVDHTGKVVKATWDTDISSINFANATDDITVKVVLNISSDSITLTPVYDATTGVLTHYKVTGVNNSAENKSISIPTYVGHIPVKEIDANSFDGFNDLTAVRIPKTVTSLGKGMFPGSLGFISWFDDRQTVTIYYEGTYTEWLALVEASNGDWDDTLGDGSRVFFLEKTQGGREIVDLDAGFVELYKKNSTYTWVKHTHPHLKTAPSDCKETGHYKNFTDYDAEGRPDRNYWLDDNGNSIVNDDGSAKTTN